MPVGALESLEGFLVGFCGLHVMVYGLVSGVLMGLSFGVYGFEFGVQGCTWVRV